MQHQGGGQLSSQGRHSWLAHQSFSSCYVLTCGGWWEGRRGRIRRKNKERLISSWGTTINTPCQTGYLPKALLPNTITLGVKGRHNSIQSSYADLFLNQDRHSFHQMYIMRICGRIIGYEKNALLFPRKWTFISSPCANFPDSQKADVSSQFIEECSHMLHLVVLL